MDSIPESVAPANVPAVFDVQDKLVLTVREVALAQSSLLGACA